MSEPTLKLPRKAEELLREFPVTEPDFEAQATAIEARLKGSPGGLVFDDLLAVPELSAEPGEPALPSSVRATPAAKSAPKTNFVEMARRSVQPKDDAKELTKELLAATAQSRRPNAAMVERVRAAGRSATSSTPLAGSAPAAISTPVPASGAAAEDAPRNSGVVARSAPQVQPAAATNNRGVIIGVLGGAVALAACVALFVRSSGEDQRTRAALAAQKAADAPVAGPRPNAPSPVVAVVNEGVVTPEALAAAEKAAPTTAEEAKPSLAKAGGGAALPAAAPAAKGAPTPNAGAKPEAVVLEDEPARAPAPSPATATAPKLEATPEPPLKPAEGSSGNVPLNPSGGAVSTALGSVRGAAQACLAGQTDPVKAVVTFASDGHVLRVSASGPSATCIQAALSKAHIAPFAKESFSATTTIRPP
jgi:hypothetical protein